MNLTSWPDSDHRHASWSSSAAARASHASGVFSTTYGLLLGGRAKHEREVLVAGAVASGLGWRGLLRRLGAEAPAWSTLLPEIPRLVHRYLDDASGEQTRQQLQQMLEESRQQTTLLAIIAIALTALAGVLLVAMV